MRPLLLRHAAAALLAPLLGCSPVHQWPSGRAPELARLRRLLVPEPVCRVYPGGAGAGDRERACARVLDRLLLQQLGEQRGHELLPSELLGSTGGPLADAARELAASRPELERFALGAADGAASPPALAARVRELCAAWRADGLVLVRMERRMASVWTGGLPFAQRSDTAIDVFDARSGRIVWRHRSRSRPPGLVDADFGWPFGPPPERAP